MQENKITKVIKMLHPNELKVFVEIQFIFSDKLKKIPAYLCYFRKMECKVDNSKIIEKPNTEQNEVDKYLFNSIKQIDPNATIKLHDLFFEEETEYYKKLYAGYLSCQIELVCFPEFSNCEISKLQGEEFWRYENKIPIKIEGELTKPIAILTYYNAKDKDKFSYTINLLRGVASKPEFVI